MPKIHANGIDMHYVQQGSGPDVILLHGVTSSLAMWYNGVLPALSPSYKVTAYDLRGHGLSGLTPTGYTSEALAGDLRALMDALGIESAVVVGHSFGGTIGLHTACLHPERVRGVVMLDSGVACLRYLRIIEKWSGWKNRPALFRERGLSLEEFLSLDREQDITPILRHGLNMPRQAGFKKGQSGLTARQRRLIEETRIGYEFRDVANLTEDRLREVQTPVLAMYGSTSPYRRMAERLGELLPHCRHEVLPQVGHFYAVHHPDLMLGYLREFVPDPLSYVSAAPRVRTGRSPSFVPGFLRSFIDVLGSWYSACSRHFVRSTKQ
jgi:3-oxoadipate enol-lactonase